MVTLSQFLNKWSEPGDSTLATLIAVWFGRNPRTLRRWIAKNETPREAAIALTFLDERWEASGKNTAIFFDL
ncbi:MAG: hypothetical protein SWY16_04470 [Cyanobacteriota bacterium]|nr:hypothetical protein [Cyanobacteriota bacterium]